MQQARAQMAAKLAAQKKEERRATEQLAQQQAQLGRAAAAKKTALADAERELGAAKQEQLTRP